MPFSSERIESSRHTSDIACHSCRRRKVKCDRELPTCRVCVGSGLACEYPDKASKPGPKVGSSQRRKRRCCNQSQEEREQARVRLVEREKARVRLAELPSRSNTIDSHQIDSRVSSDDEMLVEADPRSAETPLTPSGRKASALRTAEAGIDDHCRRDSRLNIHDFSFILHPSHEASTPDENQDTAYKGENLTSPKHDVLQEACGYLGISESSANKMIQIFFDNMVAITIFHEPSFLQSMRKVTSATQMTALLGAMMGYATRFLAFENDSLLEADVRGEGRTADFYLNLAFRCVDQALSEYDNEAPPLCLLQALTIATHCRLTHGVRRKAWRSLGLCVRLAYELNLHLLDSRHSVERRPEDFEGWCEDEEKRRVWWIIWEMDVFASTIRRTPTAMNWTQMEVLLPMHDDDWFQNRPSKSCFFKRDLTQRWKTLQECGSQSGKAWFIVINSYMMEARTISCPQGVFFPRNIPQQWPSNRNDDQNTSQAPPEYNEESRQQLEALANSVQCLVRTLPDHLRFRQQYLNFESRLPGKFCSARMIHCSIYNIYLMIQLTQLMIYRYDVFGGLSPSHTHGKRNFATFQDKENSALSQYFEAADNILNIVKRSCENHIQYINPFLTSTIWLAAAVQLLHKTFGPPNQTAVIKSRFDVLYLVYKQSVSFWGTQTAMQDNLELLKAKLEGGNGALTKTTHSQNRRHAGSLETSHSSSSRVRRTQHGFDDTRPEAARLGHDDTFSLPEIRSQEALVGTQLDNFGSPEIFSSFSMQESAIHVPTNGSSTQDSSGVTPLELTQTAPQQNCDYTHASGSLLPPTATLDSMWTDFDMSGEFHDLVTGFSRYQTPSYGFNI